jgi:hypothetical protein
MLHITVFSFLLDFLFRKCCFHELRPSLFLAADPAPFVFECAAPFIDFSPLQSIKRISLFAILF